MQSTGQGATHRSQPVHSSTITVCIKLVAPIGVLNRQTLEDFLGKDAGRLKQVVVEQGPDMGTESITVEFRKTSRVETAELLKRILTIPEVREEPPPH